MKKIFLSLNHTFIALLIIALLSLSATRALAQSSNATPGKAAVPQEAATDAKAEQIVQRAIEALGGSKYLNITTVTGKGYFTPYKDGVSGIPAAFVDYIVYPDKERTEFRSSGARVVQTNTGNTGWIYDGAAKTLLDMTPAQVEDFRFAMRTNVDYLLRGTWRKDGAKLSYAGRREAGLAKRNETVKLVYPDGLSVEFEFGAKDGLPSKALYKRTNKEGEEVNEEDRFAQPITIEGVTVPFVIDHFRAGAQTSRINYQSVVFNSPLSEALFARPANAKAVK